MLRTLPRGLALAIAAGSLAAIASCTDSRETTAMGPRDDGAGVDLGADARLPIMGGGVELSAARDATAAGASPAPEARLMGGPAARPDAVAAPRPGRADRN